MDPLAKYVHRSQNIIGGFKINLHGNSMRRLVFVDLSYHARSFQDFYVELLMGRLARFNQVSMVVHENDRADYVQIFKTTVDFNCQV